MTPMAPTRPDRPASSPIPLPALPLPMSARRCRVPIMADLTAAAAARAVVADAIRTWRVPVDPEIAVLLTSELVANAVLHGTPATAEPSTDLIEAMVMDQATFVLLTIACDAAGLRVDVHDGSDDLPVLDPDPRETGSSNESSAEAETGRGLLLVATLSDEWGFYRTPAGKAVYFTLGFHDRSAASGFRRFG